MVQPLRQFVTKSLIRTEVNLRKYLSSLTISLKQPLFLACLLLWNRNVFSWISIKNSITYPKHSQIHFITATLQKALQYHLDSGIGRLGTWNKTSLQFINTVTMRASIVVVVSLITYYVENTLGIGKVNHNNIIIPDPLGRF